VSYSQLYELIKTTPKPIAGDHTSHAYLRSGDSFYSFDFPGATLTFANGINDLDDIVGRYDSAGRTHGYLLSKDGNFTAIDFPGSVLTTANGINSRGDIVGHYDDPDGTTHGYRLSKGLRVTEFAWATGTGARCRRLFGRAQNAKPNTVFSRGHVVATFVEDQQEEKHHAGN